MNPTYERYLQFIVKLVLVVVIFLIIYLFIMYLLPFFAPFLVAVILALINEPVIDLLERRVKMPRKLAAVVSLFVTISALGFIITIGVIKIYNELVILQGGVSDYVSMTSDQIINYFNRASAFYHNLPVDITNAVNEGLKSLAPKLKDIISSLVDYLIATLKSVPKITVFVLVTLLSTFFISSDRREIRNFIYKQLPQSWSKNLAGIKINTFTALFGYFKALLILLGFTFIEVSIGLFIIGADYALLMGLIVALADAIPVLGTGLIMIPWIVWNFITGNMQMALGLTIIYLLGVIVRQILEPKIVGSQIGLHPLATLLAMYIGLSLFGVLGMILGPISIIIMKNLQQAGVIKLWKE